MLIEFGWSWGGKMGRYGYPLSADDQEDRQALDGDRIQLLIKNVILHSFSLCRELNLEGNNPRIVLDEEII